MKIHEKADIERLALNVVLGAVDEYVNGDVYYRQPGLQKKKAAPVRNAVAQLRAFQFLASEDFQFWADVAGRELDVREVIRDAYRVRQALRLHRGAKR